MDQYQHAFFIGQIRKESSTHLEGVNLNQDAESIPSYLLAIMSY
jgi:hypothetical protein